MSDEEGVCAAVLGSTATVPSDKNSEELETFDTSA